MRRLLLTAALLFATGSPGSAQIRSWSSPVNGLWDDDAKWSPANAPDTSIESAVFDRFGSFRVSLPDTGPMAIDDWTVEHGDLIFQSAGFGLAQLAVGGDARLDGELLFRGGAGSLRVDIDGALAIGPATLLDLDGVTVHAGDTTIAGGSATGATRVQLLNGAEAEFGSLSVSDTGASTNRGGLDLFFGSTARVGDLSIATGAGDTFGEVNVNDATLRQDPLRSTTLGVSLDGATGRGVLTVGAGGLAELGSVTILPTGRLRNAGGSVLLAGDLEIRGGLYDESGAPTRDFTGAGLVQITAGGRMVLAGPSLDLKQGQRLNVIDGELTAPGVQVTDGAVLGVGSAATLGAPIEVGTLGRVELLDGSPTRFTKAVTNADGTIDVGPGSTAIFAGSYYGRGTTGGGSVVFEDTVSPAVGAGVAVFDGAVELTSDAVYLAELESSTEHDTLAVTHAVKLGGELAIELGDWTPSEGDDFPLVLAASIVGSFESVAAPTLAPGLAWRLFQTPTQLSARVVAPGPAGDFNHDGLIDAADYTVWRDQLGATGPLLAADGNGDAVVDRLDRGVWASAFSAADATRAVPEPATPLALSATLLGLLLQRSKVARSRNRH